MITRNEREHQILQKLSQRAPYNKTRTNAHLTNKNVISYLRVNAENRRIHIYTHNTHINASLQPHFKALACIFYLYAAKKARV